MILNTNILYDENCTELSHNSTRSSIVYLHEGLQCIILRSYNSIVAAIDYTDISDLKLELFERWNYSTTTAKHLHKFLNERLRGTWNTATIKKAIKKGSKEINGYKFSLEIA